MSFGEDGKTSLHLATARENVEVVKEIIEYLVSEGANINVTDNESITPLMQALTNDNLGVIQCLVSEGANVRIRGKDGRTLLHSVKSVAVAEYLISERLDVHAKSNDGRTPLHSVDNVEVAQFLVSKKARDNIKDNNGWLPIHHAAFSNPNVDLIKFLLSSRGINVNVKTDEGDTPLGLARKNGNTAIAEYLTSIGARVGAPDGYNVNDWNKVDVAKANNGLKDEQVTWTNIGGEMRLTRVDASGTETQLGNLTGGALDLSGCTALTELHCSNNQLTTLDVSGCTALAILYCDKNQLTSLDVTDCTALTTLSCVRNQLTSLDVSACKALKNLYCHTNQLTALDVSKNTALKELLYCDWNRLTFSTLQLPSHAITELIYNNQKLMNIDSLHVGKTVNLASEHTINGTATSYVWKYADGRVIPANLYTNDKGVFTFSGITAGTKIYCEMTNAKFPELTLKTTEVTISDTVKDATVGK